MKKLFLVAGQSNACGRGLLSEAPTYPNGSHIWAYLNNGTWVQNPADPLDATTGEVYTALSDAPPAGTGVGPSLSFANALFANALFFGIDSIEDIGLVLCAKGGTSLANWQRSWRSDSLYGATTRRVNDALDADPSAHLSGMIWYQGEKSAEDANATEGSNWGSIASELLGNFRQDLGAPNLPIVVVKLGPKPTGIQNLGYWNFVTQAQGLFAGMPGVAVASADGLTWKTGDQLHLTTASQVTLGQRIATAMAGLL